MLMTDRVLWVALGCGGILLVVLLNSLIQNLQPYFYAYGERILNKLSPRLRTRLDKAAQFSGSADDTVAFMLQQCAMSLALALSLTLPLPKWVGFGVCAMVVLTIVRRRMQQRLLVRRFEKQWPNCLDMLAMLMRAGLSLPAALHSLAQLPSSSVAIRYLRQLHQQLNAGVSLEDALVTLNLRLPSTVFSSFCAAVLQARKSGSALTHTLMLQAEQVRNEQQLAAEKFAQEVGVKLLFPLITCFFPVTFLLILGPVFIGYL